MLVLFFFSLLVASWLQWGVLAGASFVIGSVAAAWYTKRRDLLAVAVSPPLLFFCALICVKALTAQGQHDHLDGGGNRADPGERRAVAVRGGHRCT